MALEESFVPPWRHISSEDHAKALIYDEMNKFMDGVSAGELNILDLPTQSKIIEAIRNTGVLTDITPRAAELYNSFAWISFWRKFAFLGALLNLNPYNTRSVMRLHVGGSAPIISINDNPIFDNAIISDVIKDKTTAKAVIDKLITSFITCMRSTHALVNAPEHSIFTCLEAAGNIVWSGIVLTAHGSRHSHGEEGSEEEAEEITSIPDVQETGPQLFWATSTTPPNPF